MAFVIHNAIAKMSTNFDAPTQTNSTDELCNGRAITKFCLIYFTALITLTLVFTAINHEPMTQGQIVWWWLFLGSLLMSGSGTTTALVYMIFYSSKSSLDPNTLTQKPALALAPPPVGSPPAPLEQAPSTSYKTVLTIASAQTDAVSANKYATIQKTTDEAIGKSPKAFVTMTPLDRRTPDPSKRLTPKSPILKNKHKRKSPYDR